MESSVFKIISKKEYERLQQDSFDLKVEIRCNKALQTRIAVLEQHLDIAIGNNIAAREEKIENNKRKQGYMIAASLGVAGYGYNPLYNGNAVQHNDQLNKWNHFRGLHRCV
jgi:hypothetical protein